VIGAAVTVLVAVHLWHGGRLRPGHAGAALAPIFAVWGVLAALVHTVGALTVPRIPRELRDDA
ncbi:MAG: hypothetical protein KC635_00110, partial [Myxococcales bacterium]|nr:hypothetical protein [Myxococcales bacterium]